MCDIFTCISIYIRIYMCYVYYIYPLLSLIQSGGWRLLVLLKHDDVITFDKGLINSTPSQAIFAVLKGRIWRLSFASFMAVPGTVFLACGLTCTAQALHGSSAPATAMALISLPLMGLFTTVETTSMLFGLSKFMPQKVAQETAKRIATKSALTGI